MHITGRRFNPRPSGTAELKVYANCEWIELLLNGKSLGRKRGGDCVFIWDDVTLREGRNLVRALGERGGKNYADEVEWTASGQQ